LIAVIAAAIAACGGSTQAVKSISRVNGTAGAAWTAASRSDAMGSRYKKIVTIILLNSWKGKFYNEKVSSYCKWKHL
jgi:uncharacterized protein YaaW (UPF0174 family)